MGAPHDVMRAPPPLIFYFLDINGGVIKKTEVDVVAWFNPNRAEVLHEVSDAFDALVREVQADAKWQAGRYLPDPAHPGTPTPFEVWEPEVYTGTESYRDNREVLQRIDTRFLEKYKGYKCIIVVGDQQTFDRMMKLKRGEYGAYKHVIPFNGEMHLLAHFCHAGWRLYWDAMLLPFLQLFDRQQTVLKEKWTVKDWSHYDDFMMYFTTAAMRWVTQHTPYDILDKDNLLLYARNNRTATIFLHFLFDVCVPYVTMRQLLRQASSPRMRERMLVYYSLCMHMCRPKQANKYLYAVLCVHAVWLHHNVIPSVRGVWDAMSTVSLRGLPGRNIPVDHLCEKINRYSKMIMHGIISVRRIQERVPMLNVLMPTEAAYYNMIGGVELTEENAGTGKQSHEECADRACVCLDQLLGGSWVNFIAASDDNNFRQGFPGVEPTDPFDLVQQEQASYATYVRRISREVGFHQHI